MKVFIINRDRLTTTRRMVDYLLDHVRDADPVIIDCDSTFEPLLRWYANECPVLFHLANENLGPRALWTQHFRHMIPDEKFVVTDSDLDITGIPEDVLSQLSDAIEENPKVCKAGLGLRLDDLPDTHIAERAKVREARHNVNHHGPDFFHANIATTFAVYRNALGCLYGPALRSKTMLARHMPWYITERSITNEDRVIYSSIPNDQHSGVTWSRLIGRHLTDFDGGRYNPATYGMEWRQGGGWGISDDDWRFIRMEIEKRGNIDNVLEFGAGLSTLLLSELVPRLTSYETNADWLEKTQALMPDRQNAEIRKWDGKNAITSAYDLAFVDGPAGGANRESSIAYAAKNARVVIIHDAWRPAERKFSEMHMSSSFNRAGAGGSMSGSSPFCQVWERKK